MAGTTIGGRNGNGTFSGRKATKPELPILERIGNCDVVKFVNTKGREIICLRYPDETMLGTRKIGQVLKEKVASEEFCRKYEKPENVVAVDKLLEGIDRKKAEELLAALAAKLGLAASGRVDPVAPAAVK